METKQNPTGSGEPQAMEQILENYFATSNEPLAVAFRTQHAETYETNGDECTLPCKEDEGDGSNLLCKDAEGDGSNPPCKDAEGDGSNPLCNSYEDAESDEQNTLFKDVFPNTELDVNLKLLTRSCRRMNIGEMLPGAIIRDGEGHFTFIEKAFERKEKLLIKRNPHVLQLHYINVKRKDDGTLYPTFNRPTFTQHFTFQDFCRKAARELLMVAGSVKEEELNK